jgi:quercetin dioxygenase-like cupin family protein
MWPFDDCRWDDAREGGSAMESRGATIVDVLTSLELRDPGPAAGAIYDRPIGLRLLFEDPVSGEEHYLTRYPGGTRGRLHRHSAAHTIVVIEGRLRANDQVIGPGSYAHFPAGVPMRHEAADDDGCLFVLLFHDAFDVEALED